MRTIFGFDYHMLFIFKKQLCKVILHDIMFDVALLVVSLELLKYSRTLLYWIFSLNFLALPGKICP